MGPKVFLMGILGSEFFFLWVLRASKISSWVFMTTKIFLVCTLRVQHFSRGYFVGPIFSCSWFRDSKLFSCWLHEQDWQKQKYKNTFQTMYSFLNQFQQLSIVYIRKVFFFPSGFLSRTFTNHRTAGEGHFFNSSQPLPPASQTCRH